MIDDRDDDSDDGARHPQAHSASGSSETQAARKDWVHRPTTGTTTGINPGHNPRHNPTATPAEVALCYGALLDTLWHLAQQTDREPVGKGAGA